MEEAPSGGGRAAPRPPNQPPLAASHLPPRRLQPLLSPGIGVAADPSSMGTAEQGSFITATKTQGYPEDRPRRGAARLLVEAGAGGGPGGSLSRGRGESTPGPRVSAAGEP